LRIVGNKQICKQVGRASRTVDKTGTKPLK